MGSGTTITQDKPARRSSFSSPGRRGHRGKLPQEDITSCDNDSELPPMRRTRLNSKDASMASPTRPRLNSRDTGTPTRPRLNSREIPRTYSGLYGQGGSDGDLMPFELSRNRNTDWISAGGPMLLITYCCLLIILQMILMVILDFDISFTVTHAVHCLVTLVYLHWIKGSPNFYEQGEMNGMTLWEQLDLTVGLSRERRALLVIPCILCYVACHFSEWNTQLVAFNVVICGVEILSKMSFMNGVRILGINRTTGIDDDFIKNQ